MYRSITSPNRTFFANRGNSQKNKQTFITSAHKNNSFWVGQRDSVLTSNVANQPTYQFQLNAWWLHSIQKMILVNFGAACNLALLWNFCWFSPQAAVHRKPQHKGQNTQSDIKQGAFGYPQFPQPPVPLQYIISLPNFSPFVCSKLHCNTLGWGVGGSTKCLSLAKVCPHFPLWLKNGGAVCHHFIFSSSLQLKSMRDVLRLKAMSCRLKGEGHWHLVATCWMSACVSLDFLRTCPDISLKALGHSTVIWRGIC